MSDAEMLAQLAAFEIEVAAAQLRLRMENAAALVALQWDIEHGAPIAAPEPQICAVFDGGKSR